MSLFCIHGSRLLLLIILLFIKQRRQLIAVKCLFSKLFKRKWKFWNCYPLRNFIGHLMIFFSNFCDQNWTCYRRNRHQCGQKSPSTLNSCNFLNREHNQLPNLRQLQNVTNTLWKFQTNRTKRLFAVWVGVKRGQIYISLQSNAAWSLLIFIERR